jgi:uncharacterized protein (TIGR03437 family)
VNAPTSLDGTSVTIGGVLAFVDYIGPGQVDVQAPNVAAGTQPLVVETAVGSSASYHLTVEAVDAGLLAPAACNTRCHSMGTTMCCPQARFRELTSQPANPGDEIVLYGVGFGPVNPAIPEGQIAQSRMRCHRSVFRLAALPRR